MVKWFQRSMMALGALFVVIIPVAIYASDLESEFLDNFGIFLFLIAFALVAISIISGIGTAFNGLAKSVAKKQSAAMSTRMPCSIAS
jgi:heme/copper-type cytochrome/quinol oxidase subunit 1